GDVGVARCPDLWPDSFGHYRRVVWLAQDRDAGLEAEAGRVAARFGLPLTVVDTGTSRLERELERLLAGDRGGPDARSERGPGAGRDRAQAVSGGALARAAP